VAIVSFFFSHFYYYLVIFTHVPTLFYFFLPGLVVPPIAVPIDASTKSKHLFQFTNLLLVAVGVLYTKNKMFFTMAFLSSASFIIRLIFDYVFVCLASQLSYIGIRIIHSEHEGV